MSMTDVDVYEDPILRLARDPDLNKQKDKTQELILMIHNFPLTERKVSKLCQQSLAILQSLEKIELNLKNWAFISLDINSVDHFSSSNSEDIKNFNNNVSIKVLHDCKDLNTKVNRISHDLDYITKASRTLSPLEYISDSGTLLTSLTLRNIKLKDELGDKITISYLKAKLITIATDLEQMLEDDHDTPNDTAATYKQFVVSLLKQLNDAIEYEDAAGKHECLAVISDMEQMFEAFKLERAQAASPSPSPSPSPELVDDNHRLELPEDDIDSDYHLEYGTNSMYSSTMSAHNAPMVHSITKLPPPSHMGSPVVPSPMSSPTLNTPRGRRDSISSLGTSSILHKSTIQDELPFLMSAFNSAKNFEEDVHHFKEEDKSSKTQRKLKPQPKHDAPAKRFPTHRPKLPDNPVYAESTILSSKSLSLPSSYLYANNSLLSKLGIRPQVITTDLPKELGNSTSVNKIEKKPKEMPQLHIDRGDKSDKENRRVITPLTKANLDSHTFSSLSDISAFDDYVE